MTRRLGIAFSDALVLAIGRGSKTETRRLLDAKSGDGRYDEGDELYVREAWRTNMPSRADRDIGVETPLVQYRADGAKETWPKRILAHHDEVAMKHGIQGETYSAWRPPRFMFRALARHWLLVTNTRTERLHAITDAAIHAEGIASREAFAFTWDQLHKDAGTRWADDPYVEVVRFRRLLDVERCDVCSEPLDGSDRDFCGRCEA